MAFFLEAAFLGVLLFGRKLVPPWAHFIAALMVALGTLFSAFDSRDKQLDADPRRLHPCRRPFLSGGLVPDRLQPFLPLSARAHFVTGFYVTTAFVVLGVGAYTIRRRLF